MRNGPIVMLALVLASPAAAEGIHLNWGDCEAGGGPSNVAFACNTNQQTHALVTSFVLDAPRDATSISGTIFVESASAVLPAWWEFSGCRSGSLFVNSTFAPLDACPRWNSACPAQGGINSYVVGVTGPNTARIEFSIINCPLRILPAGVELIGPVLVVNSTRTVGSPSCAGCDVGVCLTLTQLRMGPSFVLTEPVLPPDGNRVTWQGGLPGGVCARPTPSRRTVWGAVKSLYR